MVQSERANENNMTRREGKTNNTIINCRRGIHKEELSENTRNGEFETKFNINYQSNSIGDIMIADDIWRGDRHFDSLAEVEAASTSFEKAVEATLAALRIALCRPWRLRQKV